MAGRILLLNIWCLLGEVVGKTTFASKQATE